MNADAIRAAIRALPRDAETLMCLLISVECYAADLYRQTNDPDVGAVSDALTDAFGEYEAATDPGPELTPRELREERRDDEANMDCYRSPHEAA